MVDKNTKRSVDVDLEDLQTAVNSQYLVLPCHERISIADQYAKSYNSLPKRPPFSDPSRQSARDKFNEK